MKIDLYHDHHRLNYIINSKTIQDNCQRVGNSIIEKTACFVTKASVSVVEYTDGGIEEQNCESTLFPQMVIDKIEKNLSVIGKKKNYFRPLYSKKMSSSLEVMLKDRGWELKTLMPWSYNPDNYMFFYNNRKELRKSIDYKNRENFLFLGSLRDYQYSRHDTTLGTKYPVAHVSILPKDKITNENFHNHPSRKERISAFEFANQCKVKISSNILPGLSCFHEMKKYSWLVQPHGVGIRHNVYEGMCLGIPSIIEKTSYNPELFSLFPMSTFEKVENPITQRRILEVIENENERVNLSKTLIDFFELHLAPDRIANNLLAQIEIY